MRLLNDFEACGYAISGINPSEEAGEILSLGNSPQFSFFENKKNRRFLLAGPGTGLGVCQVLVNDSQPLVLSSEGGHSSLPSYNQDVFDLQQFVIKEMGLIPGKDILSAEHLFCGLGIPKIHQFLQTKAGISVP